MLSERGSDWINFATQVTQHIEQYVIPQYGDKGTDPMSEWSVEELLKTVDKYIKRYGKNSREGQQKLDFMKMAHCIQIAASKHEEKEVAEDLSKI